MSDRAIALIVVLLVVKSIGASVSRADSGLRRLAQEAELRRKNS